jgi:predicted ferric reductase
MLLFTLNLPAPIFTLLFVLYLVLVIYVLISIAKSDQSFGTKILLLALMILVPLAPIFYLIFKSPAKSARNG